MTHKWKIHMAALLLAAVALFAGSTTPVWSLEKAPLEVYRARRAALMEHMKNGVFVIFAKKTSELPEVDYLPFRQDDDFYYLTGWNEPDAILMLLPGGRQNIATAMFPGEPKMREILFLPSHNPEREKFTGRRLAPTDKDAAALTGVPLVLPIERFATEMNNALTSTQVIYTIFPGPGENPRISREQERVEQLRALAPFVEVRDAGAAINNLRQVKDASEIALLEKAVDASVDAQLAAMKAVQPGVPEYRIASLLKFTWENEGCERAAYAPIVGSGPNSTVLHYDEDDRIMQKGETVVVDAAGMYGGYAADLTRTYPVGGRFSERQRQIYELVLGAQEAAAQAIVPGKTLMSDLTALVKNYFKNSELRGPQGENDTLDHYFIHGLGHWLGLNVHDVGDYNRPLDKGMVFTLEPGLYIPEENLGIRIEDDFRIDDNGKVIKMSSRLPSSGREIEQLVAAGARKQSR